PGVQRWWPHTHGPAARHPVRVSVRIAHAEIGIDLGRVGFRDVVLDTEDDGFRLRVNGVDVFCRGACWTPVDAIGLIGPPAAYRCVLEKVQQCGMNMLRIAGPFFYEDDPFYDLCDELGILVWQDYPFANLDYPDGDPDFVEGVEREARSFLDREQLACSLAVLCGNSEVEQQAAMTGAPRELWRSALFETVLRNVSSSLRPDVPYWVSTPSGGPWPFSTSSGTSHYFGVGAYLRPLEDARRSDVRFATECLAFANVPPDDVVDDLLKNGGTPPTDPRWKARVPRDGGTGWDFDDVRDHYFRMLFGVDPATVRFADVARYLAMSRVVTGEAMVATFTEWRRSGSRCAGALVWFLRDLWPGAGWGVLDSTGAPKAAYYYLRRVLQPVTILLVDEGLNGLDVHVINDSALPRELEVRVAAFRGDAYVATGTFAVDLGPRASARCSVAARLPQFLDMTYAYRFGPQPLEGTVATLADRAGSAPIAHAFHLPGSLLRAIETDVGLEATATPLGDGSWELVVRSRRFAQAVSVEVHGFAADDSYFHLAPGGARSVRLAPDGSAERPRGTVRALNAHVGANIVIVPSSSA
ncbi:MAG TPA: hypothetical protein VEK07_04345, partial [Polyangiaceae bacterium]|nr:hypothetical protein [Polyangiaceae bacterium]